MRIIFGASSFAVLATRSLRSASLARELDDQAELWIPITQPGQDTFFYNPVRGLSLRNIPRGAETLALQSAAANTSMMSTIVPLHERKSCVPHCAWSCSQSVCEQNCHPECGVPSCETRCPKTNSPNAFKDCQVKCGEPNCAMFCPPDPCEGKKSLDCETPKCTTRCEKPHCMLDCGSSELGCKTVCPSPQCQWKCQKPASCPKPKCTMKCEVAPACGKNTVSVPPPADGMETVGPVRSAKRSDNKWIVGEWNRCSTSCGAGNQTRHVECNAGLDHYCPGARPVSSQSCSEISGCDYKVGEWTACSTKCGPGKRTRDVVCQGTKCLGARPASAADCTGRAPTCSQCQMRVWGGSDFNGWEHSFAPGEYSSVDLEFKGLKCDDVSSLEIVGEFCEAEVFEYGDFNKLHPGWSAKFAQGKYNSQDLVSRGANNNDISSFRLVRNDTVSTADRSTSNTSSKPSRDIVAKVADPDTWRSSAASLGVVVSVALSFLSRS